MSKITTEASEGLKYWQQEAKNFLDATFPKTTIHLGFTALEGDYTLSARVVMPCPDAVVDLEAGFDLVGISKFEFVAKTEVQK